MATAPARLLDPLDAARRVVLAPVARWPGVGRVLARRDARVLAQSSLGVVVAFALALFAPGVPYVLGPAVLGVPHVAAELRYLVLRRSLPRAWVVALASGCALLLASRALETWRPGAAPFASIEVALGWSLGVAGALAGAVSTRSAARGALVAAPLACCLAAALVHPSLARLVFAHAHNAITIALWVWLFRRRRAFALPTVALVAAGAAFLASGAWVPRLDFDGPWVARLVDDSIFAWPPGLVSQRSAIGLGLSYAFLQSIHYAVWLAWVPQEDVRAEGTTTFRMSWRSLVRDLGRPGLAATLSLSALVLGASALDLHRTRGLYLSLATFHGYLEVAMLAFLVARGRVRA